jgi:hypothetical protein
VRLLAEFLSPPNKRSSMGYYVTLEYLGGDIGVVHVKVTNEAGNIVANAGYRLNVSELLNFADCIRATTGIINKRGEDEKGI